MLTSCPITIVVWFILHVLLQYVHDSGIKANCKNAFDKKDQRVRTSDVKM